MFQNHCLKLNQEVTELLFQWVRRREKVKERIKVPQCKEHLRQHIGVAVKTKNTKQNHHRSYYPFRFFNQSIRAGDAVCSSPSFTLFLIDYAFTSFHLFLWITTMWEKLNQDPKFYLQLQKANRLTKLSGEVCQSDD